jgi:acetylornithine/succinyldiaminopimelate/putrescine aminotransferase
MYSSATLAGAGTEAVEAAIKLARATTRRPRLVSVVGAYHGCTMGSVALMTPGPHRDPFAPHLAGGEQVPVAVVVVLVVALVVVVAELAAVVVAVAGVLAVVADLVVAELVLALVAVVVVREAAVPSSPRWWSRWPACSRWWRT